MPVGVLGKGLTKHALKELDDKYAEEHNVPTSRVRSIMTGVTSVRSKTETTEERKDRKKIVKEYRRVSLNLNIIPFPQFKNVLLYS